MSKNLFEKALAAEGVSGQLADVARSIYQQESSSGKNTKTSNAGARGGMQIIPSTFKSVADKGWDINDPIHNSRAGIRYLKMLDKKSGGNAALTAAGYYGGPGGLEKARKGIAVSDPRNPNAPTTLQYGQQVVSRLPGGSKTTAQVAPVQLAKQIQATPQTAPFQPEAPPQLPLPPALQQAAKSLPAAPMADPWEEFNKGLQKPVEVADIAYGTVPKDDGMFGFGFANPIANFAGLDPFANLKNWN